MSVDYGNAHLGSPLKVSLLSLIVSFPQSSCVLKFSTRKRRVFDCGKPASLGYFGINQILIQLKKIIFSLPYILDPFF